MRCNNIIYAEVCDTTMKTKPGRIVASVMHTQIYEVSQSAGYMTHRVEEKMVLEKKEEPSSLLQATKGRCDADSKRTSFCFDDSFLYTVSQRLMLPTTLSQLYTSLIHTKITPLFLLCVMY